MSSNLFLDPLRMAAAVSMTTPEQDKELHIILDKYPDNEIEACIAASQYVIALFGKDCIEAQFLRILRGEVPPPPGWKQI